MKRPDFMKSSVTYKFILYKMKSLVTDNRGRLRYLESLDNILYDIFGVKNTMKKINNAYDPREISGLIDNLGVNVLLQLFNSGKMYKILEDLVQINYRMKELQKDIRKQSRKDKRDKDDVKEYNYLMDLYKKSIKYIRNKFGIKNTKTSYKRKYQNLNNIVKNKGYGDWDDEDSFVSILMRDDDYYFYDDEDDDDDDSYESTSELEDFVNMMNGSSNRRRKKSSYYDEDEDDTMSLFDDDYDMYEKPKKHNKFDEHTPSIDGELHDQINLLTDTVADLSSAVQHLLMKDEYSTVQRKRDVALRQDLNRKLMNIDDINDHWDMNSHMYASYNNPAPIGKELEILTDLVGKMQNEQSKYRDNQKVISEALDHLIQKQSGMEEFLIQLLEDSDEDDDDDSYEYNMNSSFGRPIIRDEYEIEQEDVSSLSREDLVDMINATATKTTVETSKITIEAESSPKPETDKNALTNDEITTDNELP